MTEGRGEMATGISNTSYDLSSVLFHALKGGASYDRYIRDAKEAGDEELADFFGRVRDEDGMRTDEAQVLVAERTPTAARTEGAMPGAPAGPEHPGTSSDTQPVAEELPPGDGRTRRVGFRRSYAGRRPRPARRGSTRSARGPSPEDGAYQRPTRATGRPAKKDGRGSNGGRGPLRHPTASSTGGGAAGNFIRAPAQMGEASEAEEGRVRGEESEEDKGLIDKVRDYLRGEGRERDYLRGE